MIPELPDQLLAKSPRPGRKPVTLEEHLQDTAVCAAQIFRLNGRWGQNWCRFFQISTAEEQFLLNLQVAALFHDLGKANEDFYAAVSQPGFTQQTIRHEHLSALMLCLPEVRNWLSQDSRLDANIITAAVLSHHLKAFDDSTSVKDKERSERIKNYRWGHVQTLKQSVVLYLQHEEVTATLQRIVDLTDLQEIPSLPKTAWRPASEWEQAWRKGKKQFAPSFKRDLRKNTQRRSLLIAVKAGLILSDAAASGLVREGYDISDWIEAIVHSEAIAANEISEKILLPWIQQIEQRTKKPFKFHAFQEQAAEQGKKALLLVACGGGKTLAAWKWAEQQTQKYNIGKVIFLYPTRGTATEGFRDYVGWAPEADAALVTGTAKYELEAMAENPSESIADKVFRTEADERLYALSFWSKRFFSATVDQFLSFMEHSYQSLCLLPVLADSAVIIDEVHSFDRSMFDILISFLNTFHIPVLCMTATLPQSRRDELVKAGLKVFPTATDRASEALADLKELEQADRYWLEPVADFSVAFDKAVTAYQAGLRVLWVVNTVDRCLAIAQKLEAVLDGGVLTYHSRFRLRDRQKVHANTVKAFSFSEGDVPKRAIAVTTQVCEMSLDLDADVLITEIAPVSSLVQRFGRANRHLKRSFATLHPYMPPANLPYQRNDLETANAFLESFETELVSQLQLATALEIYARPERDADGSSSFLNSGYYAVPGSFRDTDEFAIPCILDSDLDAIESLVKDRQPYDGFIVNVPHKWAKAWLEDGNPRPEWLPKYLNVVSGAADRYQVNRGFITKSPEEVELG
ncbi:Putative CRISPR-associated nuclease/helicase Cas3 [Halomicronema hongdechloris C2206]|uniref:CRISPR-associated nuclease/helicase Cas3 n=1 Tax=Halomicronema hongdechloris C2206 TaxID=1641165 RepID=A0A1Z3HLJ3_9CYAN|nr:CRISPR-associated helicase Cas3' [Halomicronema hongdechloris]ASC71155.1 Putative CRISPR-associated nuclease/helicase Cas3 [Halomicronema hongdechloris C2206]